MSGKIIQSGAKAGGNIVGGNLNNTNINLPPKKAIEKLLYRLQEEVEHNIEIQHTIEELSRYFKKRSHDGIDGLEAKLKIGTVNISYIDAIEKKEMFVKLMRDWSMYSTAQQIFAHYLARVENEFTGVIHPQLDATPEAEINAQIIDRIIKPIVDECGIEVFILNDNIVYGMIYWLAEQCFIRWHK